MIKGGDLLIVDGYNMIGAWPELIRLKEVDFDEARNVLLDRLADYQAFSGMKVIVVFDAYRVPGLGKKYKQHKVQLQFTKEKETADECIERLVSASADRRRRVYVATSDLISQHVIFGHGALRLSARELLQVIERNRKEIRKSLTEGVKGSRNSLEEKLDDHMKSIFEKLRRDE